MQEVLADSGNFPWYMTDSIAVLEDSYSVVVVNDLTLNWQLFSDVRRETKKVCKRDVHEQIVIGASLSKPHLGLLLDEIYVYVCL